MEGLLRSPPPSLKVKRSKAFHPSLSKFEALSSRILSSFLQPQGRSEEDGAESRASQQPHDELQHRAVGAREAFKESSGGAANLHPSLLTSLTKGALPFLFGEEHQKGLLLLIGLFLGGGGGLPRSAPPLLNLFPSSQANKWQVMRTKSKSRVRMSWLHEQTAQCGEGEGGGGGGGQSHVRRTWGWCLRWKLACSRS